ncbi:class V chitinase chi100 [Colletotrichum plurivorum]|uniref:Class V chitinase chi100 n=1 Tax=Colletotrichum plurivorum TaxID=2175906 RepID=A0A8H6J9X9_9PEZI|nr:class V chitinase chi100 [Colletotrichum plurivorum]
MVTYSSLTTKSTSPLPGGGVTTYPPGCPGCGTSCPRPPFPTAYADNGAMVSIFNDVQSQLSSLFKPPATTTTKTTTKTTEPPKATATPRCTFGDNILYWRFGVYQISGWGGDKGQRPESPSDWAWCAFDLPFFMKEGCIKRAIKSAGGPQLACEGTEFNVPARLPAVPGDVNRTSYEDYYRNITDPALIEHHEYHAPEGWGDAGDATGTKTAPTEEMLLFEEASL